MEGDTRKLQPASLGLFSIETGKERYTLDGILDAPAFSSWRNNVTALSQRYNLYFVATRDSIAVFVPKFPYQKLGRKPALVINPTLTNEAAQGYINHAWPHAINHLVIGDLGSEEILLVARDSGNVDAYHTRAVRDAIDRELHRFSKDRHADHVGLRAFFSQWVHESAWGLAIHTEARMIAVSANKPFHVESEDPSAKITVFAFALSTDEKFEGSDRENQDSDDSDDSEWRVWGPPASTLESQRLPSRKHNYKITLDRGHSNNIPSICFANTSEDRAGTWLFSTDIEGDMIAWNIWQKEKVNTWAITSDASTGMNPFRIGRGLRGPSEMVRGVARRIDGETDRGWLVAALDLKAFAVAEDMAEFCGITPLLVNPQQRSFGITDIAGSAVPGNSQRHPQQRRLQEDSDSDLSADSSGDGADEDSQDDAQSLDQDTDDTIHERAEQLQSRSGPEAFSHPSLARSQALGAIEDEDASASNDQDHDHDHFSQRTGSSTSLSSLNPPLSGEVGRFSKRIIRSSQDEEQELKAYGIGTMKGESSQAPHSAGSRFDNKYFPTFPLLHCSVSHMRLFNAPFAGQAHWYCGDLLTQMVPDHFTQTARYAMDRLNMIQQIPELGLVIIASQGGRCAVCSMMKMSEDGPPGLRVDWVLPTKKQEKAGLRPPQALLGIAVGPIQGMLKESDRGNYAEDGDYGDESIYGTPTSFDGNVVIMDSSEDESRDSDLERDAKRLKTPVPPSASEHRPREEPRDWSQAASVEAWRGFNYSRRYRLMLTYYDWTVLTYEIAREAPHLGIDPRRKNWRNRTAASAGYHSTSSTRGE